MFRKNREKREIESLINIFVKKNLSLFSSIAGGGTSFISDYLSISGSSKTVRGFIVPQSKEETINFLGFEPEKYCNKITACLLAEKSFKIASKGISGNPVGIGVTCSIKTKDEREGRKNKMYICVRSKNDLIYFCNEDLAAHSKTREGQEVFINRAIFASLLKAVNYPFFNYIQEKKMFNHKNKGSALGLSEIEALSTEKSSIDESFIIEGKDIPKFRAIIYSGSFNPFHEAHEEITGSVREDFGDIFDGGFYFEITKNHFSKSGVSNIELRRRAKKIYDKTGFKTILTKYPLFVDKMKWLDSENLLFIVGEDTWVKIIDPENYESHEAFMKFLLVCWKKGNKFIVFGRNSRETVEKLENSDKFGTFLDGIRIRSRFSDNYNNPISSSEIRLENR